MASMEQRNGRYYVRWRHLGESRSKSFKERATAHAFERQIENDTADGTAVDPRDSNTTLTAWARTWHDSRINLRASTREKNRHLSKYYLRTFGQAQLSQITTADIQEWVAGLPLAPSTVAEIYGELKKCLDAAVAARKLRVSPCVGIHLPSKEHKEITVLNR